MTTVGDRQVIMNTSLLVPDGEEAKVEVLIGKWNFVLYVVFKPEDADEPRIEWAMVGDKEGLRATFKGWKNKIAASTRAPIQVGQTDDGNRPVGVMFYHQRTGRLNRIDIQVMVGGSYNE